MPPDVRAAVVRLATAFGAGSDQLVRLIEWVAPGTCLPALDPVEPVLNARPPK